MGRHSRSAPNDPLMCSRGTCSRGTGVPPVSPPQLTFGHLRRMQAAPTVPTRRWREHEHQVHRARAVAAAEPRSADHDRVLRILESHLLEFIRSLGVDAAFFAVDFTDWLHRTGNAPTEFDLRRTTVLFSRLRMRGVITSDGYFATGGGGASNSCARSRWRIRALPAPSPGSEAR